MMQQVFCFFVWLLFCLLVLCFNMYEPTTCPVPSQMTVKNCGGLCKDAFKDVHFSYMPCASQKAASVAHVRYSCI